MPFKKGHKHSPGVNGKLRRDLTVELVSQLNEVVKSADGINRTWLHRIVKNLIVHAATSTDYIDAKTGKLIEGAGDLTAILAIFDRLEGKPSQKLVGPDNGPVQVEYKTVEEVHMFLLERGIDSLRVPPPPMKLRGSRRNPPTADAMSGKSRTATSRNCLTTRSGLLAPRHGPLPR